MALKAWAARQQHRAQVDEIVLASGISGVTYGITINGKTISFLTSGTVTAIGLQSGILSGLLASTEPEFLEITWAAFGSGLRATAVTPGKPFTYTVAHSPAGSGFFDTSGVVTNLSPSDWGDGTNFDPSGLPASADTVTFDGKVQTPALWRLDALSGVQLSALEVLSAFGGSEAQIGLSELDEDGDYPQYRPRYLGISADVVNVGKDVGPGIRLFKMDQGNSGLEFNVYRTGTAKEQNRSATTWKSLNTSGRANVYNGSMDFAILGNESGRLITLNVGPNGGAGSPRVNLGFGTDMASGTLNLSVGTVNLNGRLHTLNHKIGTGTIQGSGTILDFNVNGGTVNHQGTGPIGSIELTAPGATLNLGNAGPRLVISGTTTMKAGSSLQDAGFRGTYASGIILDGCTLPQVTINLGPGRTLGVV